MRSLASSSLRCLLVVGAALVVPSSVVWSASARAATSDATKIVLGPFGEKGSAGEALRDALELELVVREDILLADPDELFDELDGDDLGAAPPSRVGRALDALGQDGLLRAEPRGRTDVVVFLVRAPDGQVVYGRRLEVAKTKDDVSRELLDDLGRYLRRVRELEPLTAGELQDVEGDEGVLAGEGLPKKGVIHDPADEEEPEERPKKPPPEEERPKPEPLRPPPEKPTKKLSELDKPLPRDFDIVRASLALSPSWFTYRACPPERADQRFPFTCRARSSRPPTEVKAGLVPSLGLSFTAELAPVSFFAFDVDTTNFITSVRPVFPADSRLALIVGADTPAPDGLAAFGGTTGVGVVLRYGRQVSTASFKVGARVGYRAFYLVTQAHHLEIDGVALDDFTLLPSSMSHAAALGATVSVSFAERVRLAAELDLLPIAAHFEAPTVGRDALMPGIGGHGKIGVDVDVIAGVFVTAAGSVDALNATAEGEGSRLTRALTPFTDGQIDFWVARFDLGVGYRF